MSLLCVRDPKVGADNWFGYEISLNADNQTVFVGDHRHNFRLLESAPATVKPGNWHQLRAVLEQERLFVMIVEHGDVAADVCQHGGVVAGPGL